ncbi:hypothetical protein [Mameliella alba]|uniref:hypothetical protein n=1 Tax=Mameliella alba TaxID=561184 RepID=UPI000B537FEA|nr:hypothetical protein [Mameliella alba]MBY6122207.1 hypothetical protein [Mameliella alba]OWV39793.1 hypothetical protein CDZ95_24330 [Mameliella alba]OWV55679.1 hypothetical protein CDZ97_23090 [Mameliella alba]
MSVFTLTKTRFRDGLWEGLLVRQQQGAEQVPEIVASFEDRPIRGVTLTDTAEPGRWVVEVPVPVEALGDGVSTVLIRDAREESVLASFTLVAGEALAEDIRAEVSLLRAELDLLKRAFRKHCRDTG